MEEAKEPSVKASAFREGAILSTLLCARCEGIWGLILKGFGRQVMSLPSSAILFKYGNEILEVEALDGRIKSKDVARAFGLSEEDFCIEFVRLSVDGEGYFDYRFPLPALEGGNPDAYNVTVPRLPRGTSCKYLRSRTISAIGMDLSPLTQPCRFQNVRDISELVMTLEEMGFDGSLLGKERDACTFHIQSQQEAAHSILEQLLTNMQHEGSPRRQVVNLIALESGLGGGKTHTAATVEEELRRAIDEALRKAGSPIPAGYELHEQVQAAFHDRGTRPGRVACIMMDFSGDDGPCDRDVDALSSVFLGLRLFARGFLGVSTKELRSVLPIELEWLLTTEEVWPLVCERLRRLHGLTLFTPVLAADPEQWLVLLLTLDEVQIIQRFLEGLGWAKHTAANFCHDLISKMAEMVYVETGSSHPVGYSSPVSPSAECGVILQPVVLGTCLSAFSNIDVTQLVWKHIALQPLAFEQSKELMMLSLLSEPAWIQLLPTEAERVSFSLWLFGTVEMQGALEMGGGVPGILRTGAKALTDAAVLPFLEKIYKNHAWDDSSVSDLATAWTCKWLESLQKQFDYSNVIDSLGIAAAKQLFLLVLSGNAVRQSQPLSGCVLSDALAIGVFYVSGHGNGYYSVTLPALLLQLFYNTLSMRKERPICAEEMEEAIAQLIKPRVSMQKDAHEEAFEVMLAAQILIIAACWKALGEETVTLGCLFRAAHKGIRGGFLSEALTYTEVDFHDMRLSKDTLRLLTSSDTGGDWGVKGGDGPHRAVHLNPLVDMKQLPFAASASLLKPGYVLLMGTCIEGAVQPVADVDVRTPYTPLTPGLPILPLLSLNPRKGVHEDTLSIVRTGLWPFLEPASKDSDIPLQPLFGLVSTGKIDEATFQAAAASGKPLLILSDEACIDFMPVLQHRPVLRRFCAATYLFDKSLQT